MRRYLVYVALVLSWSMACAAEFKVGLVDMQRAMVQTNDGKKAKKTLEEEFKKRKETLHQMETKMRTMSEEFQRKVALMSTDAKNKRELELQGEMRKYQEAVAESQAALAKRQEELIEPIAKHLQQVIAEVAKREGLTLVVNREGQAVLYAADAVDVTDKVIAAYDHG